MLIILKFIHRFNLVTIKIHLGFFWGGVKSDKLIPKLIQNPKRLEIPTQLARKETVLEELIKSNTHKLKSFRECKDTILKKYSVGARTDK